VSIIRSIRRPGGKARLLPVLLPLIESCPHICYVEPFAGSFTVGFNKKPAKVNVLNDTDGALVNAFRQIKAHPDSLLKELCWRLNSREEMRRWVKGEALTEIQRAADYLHAILISFGAGGRSFGVQKCGDGNGMTSRMPGLMEKLQALHGLLNGVAVESLEWARCLQIYDAPDTLFFVDPPYTTGAVKVYSMFSQEDMERLKDALATLQGSWVLTVDDTPENRKRFAPWILQSAATASGARKQTGGSKPFKEIICASWAAKKGGA